jgi:sulfatase maturation enzyme AslB (radical SAM superfamily)
MNFPVVIKNQDSLSAVLDKLIKLAEFQVVSNKAVGGLIFLEATNNSNRLLADIFRIINKNKLRKDVFYLIDSILLYLLYKKEKALLDEDNFLVSHIFSVGEVGKIIDYYYDYRQKIKQNIINQGYAALEADYQLYKDTEASRLVLLLTHSCQLRCQYCRVRKFPAVMDIEVLYKSIELLFSSYRQHLELQFFGGEPLLEFDLLKKAVNYANSLKEKNNKKVSFIISTNGIALDYEKVKFLKENDFTVEISCDGPREYQLKNRGDAQHSDYYGQLLKNIRLSQKHSLNFYIIMVVLPDDVSNLFNNFLYLSEKGFKNIQINYALGVFWPQSARQELMRQLDKIKKFIKDKNQTALINSGALRREPVVLNAELTVDCDGGIFYETGICLEEDFYKMKQLFCAGTVYKTLEINSLSPTPLKTFYMLSSVYANHNQHFRRIILNNIDCGVYLRRELKHKSG